MNDAALRGIDLEPRGGEFAVMLGSSGSGKSTLLNILGGLDTPSAGHVWYHGEDLTHAGDAELTRFRREHAGFVFQFYNLIPGLTARENVAIVTEITPHPMPPEDAPATAGPHTAATTAARGAPGCGWAGARPPRRSSSAAWRRASR